MKFSEDCLKLIMKWEGYHTRQSNGDCVAYPDVGSDDGEPITIGWGSTRYGAEGFAKYKRTKVKLGDRLTAKEAESELLHEVARFSNTLDKMTSGLNQNQFDAAVSFFYNCGFYDVVTGADSQQTVRIKTGKFREFIEKLPLYVKGGNGKVLQGLVNRRADEVKLWNKGEAMSGSLKLGSKGAAVLELHKDLVELGYLGKGTHGEVFSEGTEKAVKWFQKSNMLKVDGIVGPITLAEIEQEKKERKTGTQMKLTRSGKKEPGGCEELTLQLGMLKWPVRSGQPWAQVFEKGGPSNRAGSMMPLPSGTYSLGAIEFAGNRDDYSASWGPGLGPVWVALEPDFSTSRSAIGLHLDAGAYGTAGCVGTRSVSDLKAIVDAMRKMKPSKLVVAW
jgi:GH24 family phage-related lysozyme (muramidase)